MGRYVAYRDGGKTDEVGFYHFLSDLLSGNTVGTSFSVSQHAAGANMSVDIATGDALIPTGTGYAYQVYADAIENPTITTANPTNPRFDIVVAYVDKAVVSSASSDNPNALLFLVVAGTPAGSPADPSDATIQAAVGAGNPFIKLARVRVNAAASSITNANITDLRSAVSVNANVGGSDGWITSNESWTYLQSNGNREYQLTISGDKTSKYSNGMRVRVARSTAPPTQCTALALASSQYAQKTTPTGLSFTDDFTCEAWIKLSSYSTTGAQEIVVRRDANNGFFFRIASITGQIECGGLNAGNFRYVSSYRAVPLNRWVHVAASMDMSGNTGTVWIDGRSVSVSIVNSGSPTAFVQAGNLAIGATPVTPSEFFDGRIADVRIWNAIRTTTQIRENSNQQLTGSETNLVGYYKLNGNFNDSTGNANNMTGQNGAVATTVDNPMNSNEHAIITGVSYSSGSGLTTLTLFSGIAGHIPNMTLNSPVYALVRTPYGFPAPTDNWFVDAYHRFDDTVAIGALNQWFASNFKLDVPTGEWWVSYDGGFAQISTVAGARSGFIVFLDTTPVNGLWNYTQACRLYTSATGGSILLVSTGRRFPASNAAFSTYTLYGGVDAATGSESWRIYGTQIAAVARAECAYA